MTYVYVTHRRDFEGEVYLEVVCADEYTAILAKKKLMSMWPSSVVWYAPIRLTTAEDF